MKELGKQVHGVGKPVMHYSYKGSVIMGRSENAVYCRPDDDSNYRTFERVLAGLCKN